jgi:hypothetical protein
MKEDSSLFQLFSMHVASQVGKMLYYDSVSVTACSIEDLQNRQSLKGTVQ